MDYEKKGMHVMIAGLKLAKSRLARRAGIGVAALVLCLNGTALYAQASSRFSLSASTLQFSVSDTNAAVPSQTVLVEAAELTPFETSVGYMSPESGWLSATADASQSKVVVSVNANRLEPGLYMGYMKVATAEAAPIPVTVTLRVTGASFLQNRLRRQPNNSTSTPSVTTTPLAVNTVNAPAVLNFTAPVGGNGAAVLNITGNSTEKVYIRKINGGT